ncbi:hypothetical protein ACH5RR_012056 [Cinchona calisaya]|uniref:Uncharacterized protein n=1 Tax=Cinchona calisaya TaxID=153742 RepID=A0ABD3AA94_9GENT
MDLEHGGNGFGNEYEGSSDSGNSEKQYHRHSAEQIQQLEAFFKDCSHPNENQRQQLGRDLGLEPKQIKFWFQNKRTQTKAQNERVDNNTLRTENERFRRENLAMRETVKNLMCTKCEGSESREARLQNIQRLRVENAWLNSEYEKINNMLSGFSRRPSTLGSFISTDFTPHSDPPEANFLGEETHHSLFHLQHMSESSMNPMIPYNFHGIDEMEKSVMLETAVAAMDELVELSRIYEPIWIRSPTHGGYFLHQESYNRLYPKTNRIISSEAWIESSKESGIMSMTAMDLINIFRDPQKWMEFFPTIVTEARIIEALDSQIQGGSLYLMHEKLHVLSPLVASREFKFLRYIRQFDSTMWVIVHVSYDFLKELEDASSARYWMFPSGCIIQDMQNGKANVTWVEHVQVDDKSPTHQLYKDVVHDSQAYGARRWIITLQRMCERFAFSTGSRTIPRHELEGVIDAPEAWRNLTKLSQKMVKTFCEVLSMPEKLDLPQLSELNNKGFKVSLHKSDVSSQPNAMIVCVATSIRLPTSFENLFDFIKDENARAQWDVLFNGNSIHKIAHMTLGTHPGNAISLMQHPKDNNKLILQESSIDSLGAFLIYASVELSDITSTINGQDITNICVLPSGFMISSDGGVDSGIGASTSSGSSKPSSSLLTLVFQLEVCLNTSSEQLNMESVATVHTLINSTIQKIRVALGSKFE